MKKKDLKLEVERLRGLLQEARTEAARLQAKFVNLQSQWARESEKIKAKEKIIERSLRGVQRCRHNRGWTSLSVERELKKVGVPCELTL